MATLVAGLNACLTREEAILVLSTAFSLCYDPTCVLPMRAKNATWFHTNIPSQLALFFDFTSAMVLQRPRYGLDCTLGRRLREDYILMSRLAATCGLQEEISRKVNFGCKPYTRSLRTDLTLTLVALASQSSSWQASKLKRGTVFASHCPDISFHDGRLWVNLSMSPVIDLLYAIQSVGIPITIHEEESHLSPYAYKPSPSDLNVRLGLEHNFWFNSNEYNHILKTRSWWPNEGDFLDWKKTHSHRLISPGRDQSCLNGPKLLKWTKARASQARATRASTCHAKWTFDVCRNARHRFNPKPLKQHCQRRSLHFPPIDAAIHLASVYV